MPNETNSCFLNYSRASIDKQNMHRAIWTYFRPVHAASLEDAYRLLEHDEHVWVTIPLLELELHAYVIYDRRITNRQITKLQIVEMIADQSARLRLAKLRFTNSDVSVLTKHDFVRLISLLELPMCKSTEVEFIFGDTQSRFSQLPKELDRLHARRGLYTRHSPLDAAATRLAALIPTPLPDPPPKYSA